MSSAVRDSSLTGRVRSLDRTALGLLVVVSAVSTLALLLLLLEVPRAERYASGTRAVHLSHLAMVDQQTGLRAYVATRQDRFLEAYRRGRDALPGHDAQARRAFADQPAQLARLAEAERRQRAWVDGWALEALGGLPEGETAASFLSRDKALFDAYRQAEADAAEAADAARERGEARQVRLLTTGVALEVALLVGGALLLRRRSAGLRADAAALAREREQAGAPELPEARRAAEQADEQADEATSALATVSHEIRAPAHGAMTASALVEDRDPCLEAGMDDHLDEPVPPQELAAALDRARPTAPTAPAAAPPAPPVAALVDAPGPPVVDGAVLAALTGRLGDRAAAFRETLVQTWRTETGRKLTDLDRAAAGGDRVLAARVCHAVKSGSAALGALRLARLCEQLDGRLRGDEPVDLADAATTVRAEAEAADAAFAGLPD